jgi:hypothetical protein
VSEGRSKTADARMLTRTEVLEGLRGAGLSPADVNGIMKQVDQIIGHENLVGLAPLFNLLVDYRGDRTQMLNTQRGTNTPPIRTQH